MVRRPKGRRTIRIAVLALAALAAATLAACGSTGPIAHLVVPNTGGTGFGLRSTTPGTPYTFGFMIVCLDRPGTVTIDKVIPVDPYGGLHIDAFRTEPNLTEMGDGLDVLNGNEGTISQLSTATTRPRIIADSDRTRLTQPCHLSHPGPVAKPSARLLLIQVSKPGDASAGDEATGIVYTSGGKTYTTTAAEFVYLCNPSEPSHDCH